MVPDSRAMERLPSLPQVLLRILDAIHSERADYQQIADIVRHDTAMAARLLGVANSSYYGRAKGCQTIERALLFLGTDTVKTIVITASIKQFFNRFNPHHGPFVKAFWRRSLISANFAHILANLTGYPAPEEAYLCGLLMDVGQLILLNQHDQRYLDVLAAATDDRSLLEAERSSFQRSHNEIGADMVDAWQLSGFSGDAVRYHHEAGAQILDAHHLVKIINLASLFSAPGPIRDEAIEQADQLFSLTEALTRELRERIDADVQRIAGGLNIDISDNPSDSDSTSQQLGERLGQLSQLSQMNSELWRDQSRAALEQTIRRIVFMTLGIERCLLFTLDEKREKVSARTGDPQIDQAPSSDADFIVPLLPQRSLVTDALLMQRPLSSADSDLSALAVIDRQLLKLCETDHILCLPLSKNGVQIGVLVLGINTGADDPQASKPVLLAGLCSEIASAMQHHQQQIQNAEASTANGGALQLKISEAVHEASNPLSIIRNYLEMLRVKLGEEHQANADLNLIKQEIDRVGTILLRLREPESAAAGNGDVALNKLITDIARIFEQSLCATHQIDLQLNLAESIPLVRSNVTHLQQVLTNLLKNAIEALPPGGKIVLGSESGVIVNGRNFAVVTVADNGPGIPEPVLRQLFSPVVSTKGTGHSGIGLSITKKLMDEIGGSILCKSNKTGTQFQIFIPV
jgi:HD-like signal output (HDOD) protein/signal transduction histidine kinase